jgi:hypothetical protein
MFSWVVLLLEQLLRLVVQLLLEQLLTFAVEIGGA